jgi:hypothetical protein
LQTFLRSGSRRGQYPFSSTRRRGTADADEIPLQSIAFQQRTHECSDILLIKTGHPQERPAQYEIIEPIQLVFRINKDDGRYNQLEILTESDLTKFVFHLRVESAVVEELARAGAP